ncbi:gliding motility-associated C-terminal domain-containing protein [Flavobacterium sp. 3-210]
MKNISSHIFLYLPLLLMQQNYAQTVNLGDLYVGARTIMSTESAMENKSTARFINDGDFYLYDHYYNDGIVSFTAGAKSGVTHMVGSSGFQDISGNSAMDWYDAEFDNNSVQPSFHLSNEVRIFGSSNFKSGIIDNLSYDGKLFFLEDATAVNASDKSYVSGYVHKSGTDDFHFPIGDSGHYRYAGITLQNTNENAFAGRYFFQNSDLLYPHSAKQKEISLIDDQEYWAVDKTKDGSEAIITLTWDQDTTPESIYSAPLDEMHIVRWDASKKIWVDQGGAVDASLNEISTVIHSSDYGIFTLARLKSIDKESCDQKIAVYNAVSPNGDGINDYLQISGLSSDCGSENTIEIYNRWGVKVYATSNYGSNGNFFKGYSEGRTTISQNELLPAGTYFYILHLKGENKDKTGYLYLSW